MQVNQIENMFRGWFVGDFDPVVLRSTDVEVAVKSYSAGDGEAPHLHKVATEITVVISGKISMNGQIFGPGSILTMDPGEVANFSVISDAVTVVVKMPSIRDDKYEV